jgi:hypothetical protein
MLSLLLIVAYNNFLTFGLKHILNESYEVTCRISSLSHATVSTIVPLLYFCNIVGDNIVGYCTLYNIVYTLSDIYLYYTNKISPNGKTENIIHHIFFIFVSCVGYKNYYFYSRAILTEASTIFLNLSWFSYKNKISFVNLVVVTKLLWITFLLFRIINLYILTYQVYYSTFRIYSAIGVPFIILNNYWFYLLTIKLIKLKNNDDKKFN